MKKIFSIYLSLFVLGLNSAEAKISYTDDENMTVPENPTKNTTLKVCWNPDSIDNEIENTENKRPIITALNNDDIDNDEIKDIFDMNISVDTNIFAGIKLKISGLDNLADYKIKLSYSASDPAKTLNDKPAPGIFRLWKKKSNENRNPESIKDGGDYIPPSTSADNESYYNPSDLLSIDHEAVFYLETVNMPAGSSTAVPVTIKVMPKVSSEGSFACEKTIMVNPISLELVTTDGRGGIIPVDSLLTGMPRPRVVLNTMTSSDVQIQESNATITIQGHILDPIADNVPEGLADIASVQLYLDGDKSGEAIPVRRVDGETKSFWRQHPYKGEFGPVQVTIPLEDGKHIITVESSANAAELTGYDELSITLKKTVVTDIPAVAPVTQVANIYLPSALGDTTQDKVKYFWDSRGVLGDDAEYQEKADELTSSEFYGKIDSLDAKIKITKYTPLDTAQKDAFIADVPFVLNEQVGYLTALFTETGINSKLFRAKISFDGSDAVTHDEWSVSGLSNLGGSGKSDANYHTIRVKGISNPADYKVVFDGKEFDLVEYSRYYYLKGSPDSLNIMFSTYSMEIPGLIVRLIFDPETGAIAKVKNFAGEQKITIEKLDENDN